MSFALQESREAVREHSAWLEQEKAEKEFRVAEKKRKSEPAPVPAEASAAEVTVIYNES